MVPIQEQIVSYLQGVASAGASAHEISKAANLAVTTTREHLEVLTASDLVRFEDQRGLIGRPRRRYFISTQNFSGLKKQYSWLSTLLLEELADTIDEQAMSKLMAKLAQRVTSDLQPKLAGLGERERIHELMNTMNELGYDVSLKYSDNPNETLLEAKNCVYHKVAVQHPKLCEFDIELLQNVSGKSAKLQCCIARGAKTCRFQLKDSAVENSLPQRK